MNALSTWTRRDFFKVGAASAAAAGAWGAFPGAVRAEGGTVNFADIGVGDPGGDWSLFTKATNGWNVNLVAIGNAPKRQAAINVDHRWRVSTLVADGWLGLIIVL